eukprot:gene5073-5176_t
MGFPGYRATCGPGVEATRLGNDDNNATLVFHIASGNRLYPFAHYWKRSVGSGHASLGLRQDWRQHIKKVHDELGFTGVRFHGLFDDDMTIVQHLNHSKGVCGGEYGFYNIDSIYDYLLSIGIKPVVELSFMPGLFAGCAPWGPGPDCATRMHYRGIAQPPTDWCMWEDLVSSFARHLIARYGLQEVSQWHFEVRTAMALAQGSTGWHCRIVRVAPVWNELWGMPFPDLYMPLHNASARGIKSADPSLKVGGPATMQCRNLSAFVDAASQQGLPVDFVSTHLYPSDPECDAQADPDCFAHIVQGAIAAARGKPLLLTEYNSGLHDPARRNTAQAAAF